MHIHKGKIAKSEQVKVRPCFRDALGEVCGLVNRCDEDVAQWGFTNNLTAYIT